MGILEVRRTETLLLWSACMSFDDTILPSQELTESLRCTSGTHRILCVDYPLIKKKSIDIPPFISDN